AAAAPTPAAGRLSRTTAPRMPPMLEFSTASLRRAGLLGATILLALTLLLGAGPAKAGGWNGGNGMWMNGGGGSWHGSGSGWHGGGGGWSGGNYWHGGGWNG